MDIRVTDVDDFYTMPCFFSTLCKIFNQNTR